MGSRSSKRSVFGTQLKVTTDGAGTEGKLSANDIVMQSKLRKSIDLITVWRIVQQVNCTEITLTTTTNLTYTKVQNDTMDMQLKYVIMLNKNATPYIYDSYRPTFLFNQDSTLRKSVGKRFKEEKVVFRPRRKRYSGRV